MKDIHEKTWAIIRDAIEDYTFSGSSTTVGFVEGVLLLAENLPREVSRRTSELLSGGDDAVGLHGTENRRSWALTGLAIRAAYGLGLDQIAIEINEAERTADVERARSTWTWCYLYDRTIGLRTGLAFWSRGPSLCFVGYSHISQTGERAAVANFPYMLNHGPSSPNANEDTDSASLMQALVELTQIMTNAHDILYPSKSRTDILVRQGEYFKVSHSHIWARSRLTTSSSTHFIGLCNRSKQSGSSRSGTRHHSNNSAGVLTTLSGSTYQVLLSRHMFSELRPERRPKQPRTREKDGTRTFSYFPGVSHDVL
jgi:hypothetical protein